MILILLGRSLSDCGGGANGTPAPSSPIATLGTCDMTPERWYPLDEAEIADLAHFLGTLADDYQS